MLSPEQDSVLEAMQTAPERWWPSTDLKNIIWGRSPALPDRKVRRILEGLEEGAWIAREGNGPATRWKLLKRAPSREMKRPSADLALALLKLRQLAGSHLPQRLGEYEQFFASAAQALGESAADSRLVSAKAWIGKTVRLDGGYPLIPPAIDPETFHGLLGALYRDETLSIRYRKADQSDGGGKVYEVLPYALVEKGPFWYLVVRNRRSSGRQGDPFLMRCDRILEARNIGYVLERDPDFDLDGFVQNEKVLEWFPDTPQAVVLRVWESNNIPSQFRVVRIAEDQATEECEGGFVIRATVAPSVALRNLLLQHAPFVEVLSPASLRTEVAQMLEAAIRRYGKPGEGAGSTARRDQATASR